MVHGAKNTWATLCFAKDTKTHIVQKYKVSCLEIKIKLFITLYTDDILLKKVVKAENLNQIL